LNTLYHMFKFSLAFEPYEVSIIQKGRVSKFLSLPLDSSICVPNMKTQLYFCFQIIRNTNDAKIIHLNLLTYTVFSIYNSSKYLRFITKQCTRTVFKKVSGGLQRALNHLTTGCLRKNVPFGALLLSCKGTFFLRHSVNLI